MVRGRGILDIENAVAVALTDTAVGAALLVTRAALLVAGAPRGSLRCVFPAVLVEAAEIAPADFKHGESFSERFTLGLLAC